MSFVMSSTIQPSRVRYVVIDSSDVTHFSTLNLELAKRVAYRVFRGSVRIAYQEIK